MNDITSKSLKFIIKNETKIKSNFDEIIELNDKSTKIESYSDSLESLNTQKNDKNYTCLSTSSINSKRNSCDSSGTGVYDVENATNSFMPQNKQSNIINNKIYVDSLDIKNKDKSIINIDNFEEKNIVSESNEKFFSETQDHNNKLNEYCNEFNGNVLLSLTKNLSLMKRRDLKDLIYELYAMKYHTNDTIDSEKLIFKEPLILIEGFLEKLPNGKNLKNSILLTWKKNYFRLNSIGILNIYDVNDRIPSLEEEPNETYNLMGGNVEYQLNKIISFDDCRGNCLVVRCIHKSQNCKEELFSKWKNAFDSQIIDRSDSLWIRPTLSLNTNYNIPISKKITENIVIVDIGTCSVRAGLYYNIPQLPKIFIPSVCSKDTYGKLKVGFDAFDSILESSPSSTIDLHKSFLSASSTGSPLIFPFKSNKNIDKLNINIESIKSVLEYIVEKLNIDCSEYQILIITSNKLNDKANIQLLNLVLDNDAFKFQSALIINQTLLTLYFYNTNLGIVTNLGEKIDIVPICNGVSFQSGISNLAYGGNTMAEFLNSFISRGHINYVNDIEQYLVRYIKEKSCYSAMNYEDELNKMQNEKSKHIVELNELIKVEIPETARFKSVEGLFNPELWGIDGLGIHKLIQRAIQSSSMDLRKDMARNIYLSGGMSRIPGLKERLEKELNKLFPSTLKIKINCSEYSYHSAYLGGFKFIQQPEYKKLLISRTEWINESVECLKKWRMI